MSVFKVMSVFLRGTVVVTVSMANVPALAADISFDKMKHLAESGDPIQQSQLGIAYIYGDGVKKDEIKGADWIRKSAKQGNANSQSMVAAFYYDGSFGFPKNYKRAFEYHLRAANQGDVYAYTGIGLAYSKGHGVQQDDRKAFYYYSKSAIYDDPMAQYGLGVAYANGKGVKKDYSKAKLWYKKSCINGNTNGCASYKLLNR